MLIQNSVYIWIEISFILRNGGGFNVERNVSGSKISCMFQANRKNIWKNCTEFWTWQLTLIDWYWKFWRVGFDGIWYFLQILQHHFRWDSGVAAQYWCHSQSFSSSQSYFLTFYFLIPYVQLQSNNLFPSSTTFPVVEAALGAQEMAVPGALDSEGSNCQE